MHITNKINIKLTSVHFDISCSSLTFDTLSDKLNSLNLYVNKAACTACKINLDLREE